MHSGRVEYRISVQGTPGAVSVSTTIPGQSTQNSDVSRRVSTVRLSAQFVNRLCARIQKSAVEPSRISGVLFGVRGERVSIAQGERVTIVQAFKSVGALQTPGFGANGREQAVDVTLR